MPVRWHDRGRLYEGCLPCFYQGRLLHLTILNDGRRALIEATCPHCDGLGYRLDASQPCTEPVPLDDDDRRMARKLLTAVGRCPDCDGYGQTIHTEEDDQQRTIITSFKPCLACAGAGTQR